MIYEGQREARILSRRRALRIPFMFHLLATVLHLLLHVLVGAALSDDGANLLAFKRSIKFDPYQVFSNWNENDTTPCHWTGVTCDPKSSRVISLNITGSKYCDADCSEAQQPGNRDSFLGNISSCSGEIFHRTPVSFGSTNGSARAVCGLTGVIPPEIGNLVQLQVLVLAFNCLYGRVPDELGRLSCLHTLDMRSNLLTGSIPSTLGKLSNLAFLDLSDNCLNGEIPKELLECKNLCEVDLAGNYLSGKVLGFLHSLPKLQHLSLSSNNLDGPIPLQSSESCDALESLHLGGNHFFGTIPPALGNCSRLRSLALHENDLFGSLPPELGRLPILQLLDVSKNGLSGELPAEIGNCTSLSVLILTKTQGCLSDFGCSFIDRMLYDSNLHKPERNKFEGSLPSTVTIIPHISLIWAPRAGLDGVLPDDWGMCQVLTILNLAENNFTGKFPSGLASCSSLVILDLSSNQLQGSIPPELSIPCMLFFNVSRNSLSGAFSVRATTNCSNYWNFPITASTGQPHSPFDLLSAAESRYDLWGIWLANPALDVPAQGFIIHDLRENSLLGPLPGPLIGSSTNRLKSQYALYLSGNQFTGDISASMFSVCGNVLSFRISLGRNQLSGELPAKSIESCSSLVYLDFSNNQLTGDLPREVSGLRILSHVDLGSNSLNGSIPHQWGKLLQLQYLNLQGNRLSGVIPAELGKLLSLQKLDLSKNHLMGEIPRELGQLTELRVLFLNNNYFSGRIPETFCNLSALNSVNMAFNNLSGPIPQLGSVKALCSSASFDGNPLLEPCHVATYEEGSESPGPLSYAYTSSSSPPKKPKLDSVLIAGITSGSAIFIVLFILALLFQYTRRQTPRHADYRSSRKEVVTFTTLNFNLTYENVVRATGNFSVDNLIGNGGFGATYKAELMPGLVVAVKRLAVGRFQGVQQFDTEIRTLGRIRHPNLVTLVGYYASESEMFLIYNYFPRGNLEGFIHNLQRGEISWQIVHKIALRIAQALAFLHDDCFPRVLHRDIKPSNILLDNNLNAYLSDFGLARLLGASETHATTDVAGTFGYVAPEYALTCRVSDKADVYSYGVVLLELLSGKRALDPCFSDYGDGFNIVGWVCLLIGQCRTHEIFIVELWELGPESHLLEALKLAVMCTVESLVIRPSMRQVVERLRSIQPSMPFS